MNRFIHQLKPMLDQIHPIDEPILEAYLERFSTVQFNKKELITRQGQTERYMYIVLKGYQRSYYEQKGKEHTMAFTYPPSFSGVPESFFTQTPSRIYLECLTDSEMLRISYEEHQEMLRTYRELETFFRKGTELLLKGVLERHLELMAFDIEERFRLFAKRSPHLLNAIPQKYLASYLRIDPTNFSKLMNSIRI